MIVGLPWCTGVAHGDTRPKRLPWRAHTGDQTVPVSHCGPDKGSLLLKRIPLTVVRGRVPLRLPLDRDKQPLRFFIYMFLSHR